LCGCGKTTNEDIVKRFKEKIVKNNSYTLKGTMTILSNEDTFSYDVKVYYMDEDYFKVNMVNTLSNHEQVILRNNNDVYVVTPSLNKSYKFVSEWPYNSSQSYILNSLAKDISNDKEIEFQEGKDSYTLKVDVDYPNNDELKYELLQFDKKMNLKNVSVYDGDDIVAIKVDFIKIDYKANLSKDDFDVNAVIDSNCCGNEIENSEETSALKDIIYPLYVPANTYLKNREFVNTDNGERVILTFNGEKNFVLIEEKSVLSDKFEVIPVYGDPLMLNDTIGALSSNSLSWTSNNVDYYLASNDLSTSEILSIAGSMSVSNIVSEK
jgi:outer membrane lipoprotein-sorting protein